MKNKNPQQAKRTQLSDELLKKIDAYWRAANYLSVGQIYLYDNPLLRKPLTIKHVLASGGISLPQ